MIMTLMAPAMKALTMWRSFRIPMWFLDWMRVTTHNLEGYIKKFLELLVFLWM